MNRSYRKNVLRTIKSTFSRFLAIFAIVALGVGFLAGLLSSPGDMRLSADAYCDDTNLFDLRVVSTLGLTEDDLGLVRQAENVEEVLPVHDTDLVLLSEEKDSYTARVHTLPKEGDPGMNDLILLTGRMPEKPGECVKVQTRSLVEGKEWIGETLTPDRDEEEETDDGLPDKLTVVGTVKSAAYMSMEQEHTSVGTGTVGLILYTPDESFGMDYYTGFYLTLRGAKELDSFGSEYEDKVSAVTEALEALGEKRAQVRYEEIVDDANKELADAKQEYADKKAEAEEKLRDAEKELEDGEQELADNEKKLQDAKNEIDNGWAELADQRNAYRSQTAAAQEQIDSGYRQIAQYQAQLDAGKKPLDEAQAQLTAGYEQLEQGDKQLAEAKEKLDETEAQLAGLEAGKDGLWQIAGALGLPVTDTSDAGALSLIEQMETASPQVAEQFSSLKAGLLALAAQGTDSAQAAQALEAGKAEYEQNLAAAQAARAELDENQKKLDEQAAPLKAQQARLDSQKAELDRSAATLRQAKADAEAQFASAEAELYDAQAQYDDGQKKLEDGRKELADGRKEYEDSKKEADEKLLDADEQIKDAESQIRDIEEGKWYVFSRDDNAGISSYGSNAEKIAAIATVFPVFFFLVAALVALTTMTRMVEEERQQIGTLKALGYSSRKIAAKYLLYAAFASVLGCAAGLLVGLRLFPYVIITAYNIMYDIPKALTPFNLPYSLFASAAAVACTLLATLSACWAELREVPARLMLPKAPKAGKRVFLEYITPLWKRLKFTQKVTARNLIRYKKRFFMTVIGIAGCTALLVVGFGLRDSVFHIVSWQYDELNQYELMIALKDESALEGRDLQAVLNDETDFAGFLPVLQDSGKAVPKKGDPADAVTITVPSDVSAMPDYFQFRHRNSDEPVRYDENAVVITEKLAERQHLKVGGTLTVENQDGKEGSFVITDICENYAGHYLYISPAAYEKAFGESAEMNMLLCKMAEGWDPANGNELSTSLLECRDVAAARFTSELSESFGNSIKSINSVIMVIIICAGALAFVVLYNLNNINISEREKELATIKVLGFYDAEVSAYIFRETAALTLIGAAVGLVLGMFLHGFVIRTAEIDVVMFGRTVFPMSYVYSALLTIVFSLLVNLAMHRKLKKISMVESMKAPE